MTEQTRQPDNAPVDDIASATIRLRRHYGQVILPIWQAAGFNQALDLPHEAVRMLDALHVATTTTAGRYRAMACARQLYVFSQAGDKAHADRLFHALDRYFHDYEQGGFFYSVDAAGTPQDTDKDLYTHAFVVFACSAYMQRFPSAEARKLIAETVELIASRFSKDHLNGLPNALLSNDFRTVRTPSRQNPLMHLAEAYLLAQQAWGNSREGAVSADFLNQALTDLLERMVKIFVCPQTGCILELPTSESGTWIEPGHQFEWFYLAYGSRHPAFQAAGLQEYLLRAFEFSQIHGVENRTGGVVAKLDQQGNVLDSTQRIWAQTEYLRALAHHPALSQQAQLLKQIGLFEARFLHAKGWHEVLSADDQIIRDDMPSTTPYHLASCYFSLP